MCVGPIIVTSSVRLWLATKYLLAAPNSGFFCGKRPLIVYILTCCIAVARIERDSFLIAACVKQFNILAHTCSHCDRTRNTDLRLFVIRVYRGGPKSRIALHYSIYIHTCTYTRKIHGHARFFICLHTVWGKERTRMFGCVCEWYVRETTKILIVCTRRSRSWHPVLCRTSC